MTWLSHCIVACIRLAGTLGLDKLCESLVAALAAETGVWAPATPNSPFEGKQVLTYASRATWGQTSFSTAVMAGRQKGRDWQGSAEDLTALADLAVYNEGQGTVCWIITNPSPGRFMCFAPHIMAAAYMLEH